MNTDYLIIQMLEKGNVNAALNEALDPFTVIAQFTQHHSRGGVTYFSDGKRLHFIAGAPHRSSLVHADGTITRPDRFGRLPVHAEPYYAKVFSGKTGINLGPLSKEHLSSHRDILKGGRRVRNNKLWSTPFIQDSSYIKITTMRPTLSTIRKISKKSRRSKAKTKVGKLSRKKRQ